MEAVDNVFGGNIDDGMLIKIYGSDCPEDTRYSPAQRIGARKENITGNPDKKHLSTAFVERQDLTMQMHMRRFTRLTNTFSKKIENQMAATALHVMCSNFLRIHQTLQVTPAMAAGASDRVWEVSDVVVLPEAREDQILLAAQAERSKRSYARFA